LPTDSHTSQVLLNWASVATVLLVVVQILGFIFVVLQVRGLQKSLHSTAHSNIYARYADTVHYFLENPKLYPYFRQNVSLKDSKPAEETASQVRSLCELTTALFEHATLERHNMPHTSWTDCWLPYIRTSYEQSNEMRVFFEDKTNQYYANEYRNVIASEVAPKIKPRWVLPTVNQRPA
jgi:hypothetical protein